MEANHSTITEPTISNDESITAVSKKSHLNTRVVLPEPDEVDAEEESDQEFVEEENDFLADFPDETENLELINSRIRSLAALRLPRFADHLKRFCLRQNYISYLDPEIFRFLINLEELDFYDNRIKTVGDALNHLCKMSVLDLSFNVLRAVPDTLGHLTSLTTLYFVQNRISKITGFESAASLRSLELGGNKIRKIENLDALVNLEELWLGKNKITKIENLSTLKRLKILALPSNRITELEGLESLENLEELYLSHNGIKRLEGLDYNVKLKTLDLGNNFISVLENVSHLTSLEDLWLNGNKIPNLQGLELQLRSISSLETLYLEANPCQTTDMAGYRRKIILALPQLKQIDATFVRVT